MPQPKIHESHAARTAAYRARLAKSKPPVQPHYTALKPGIRRWNLMIEHVRDTLQILLDERQEYFDDRSEAWQESEKAEEFTEKSDSLQEALDTLEALDT